MPPPALQVAVIPYYQVQSRVRSLVAPAPPLHVRRPKAIDQTAPVAPFYVPRAGGSSVAGAQADVGVEAHPGDHPPGSQAELGRALRWGGVHCGAEELPGLSQADRNRCAERLGAGAKTAAWLPPGLSADKQARFDAAARHKEACRRDREAPIPTGLSANGGLGEVASLKDGPC